MRALPFIYAATALMFGVSASASSQDKPKYDQSKPAELVATDPEVAALLDDSKFACGPLDTSEIAARLQKAFQIAEERGLLRDRALAEAALASVYTLQGKIELAFATLQKALQDATETKNSMLEADVLITLSSFASTNADSKGASDLLSRALRISRENDYPYEESRALGELGKIEVTQGKTDQAGPLIDEALQIDRLNGYRFEASHMFDHGLYLAAKGQTSDAIDYLASAKLKALSVKDEYTFLSAETAYLISMIRSGRTEEAVAEATFLKQGDLTRVVQNAADRSCLQFVTNLPLMRIALFEDIASVLHAANRLENELEVWRQTYSYSVDNEIVAGEAEAAQRAGDLSKALNRTDDALKYYGIAADLYRKTSNAVLLTSVQISRSLLLIQVGRPREALPFEEEVASYAEHNHLRNAEFLAHGVRSEIYKAGSDLNQERDELEKAVSLIRPGPYDSEIDNRLVLQDYLRLGDIYRDLQVAPKELVSIDDAFAVAAFLKDQATEEKLVGYLDQRLADLKIRELVVRRASEGKLAEALVYASVLVVRDLPFKPGETNPNWDLLVTLPFKLAQDAKGAAEVVEVLGQVGGFLGFSRIAFLDALCQYYIGSGNDPALAEKYALQSEEIADASESNVDPLRARSSCVLALAYSREQKSALAMSTLTNCLEFAKRTGDEQAQNYAEFVNVFVRLGTGDLGPATESIKHVLSRLSNPSQMRVALAQSLMANKLYDRAQAQLDIAVSEFSSEGNEKAIGKAYMVVGFALNSDTSATAQQMELHYLKLAQSVFNRSKLRSEEAQSIAALAEYYLKSFEPKVALESLSRARQLAEKTDEKGILAVIWLDLGNTYFALRDFNRAVEFHRKAAMAYGDLGEDPHEAQCLERLSQDYAAMNDIEHGLSSLVDAQRKAKLGSIVDRYLANIALSDFYRQQGQFEQALGVLHDSADLMKAGGDLQRSGYAHLGMAEVDGTKVRDRRAVLVLAAPAIG